MSLIYLRTLKTHHPDYILNCPNTEHFSEINFIAYQSLTVCPRHIIDVKLISDIKIHFYKTVVGDFEVTNSAVNLPNLVMFPDLTDMCPRLLRRLHLYH